MTRHLELACAWGGMIFAVLFAIGFVGIAHFVPPLDPNATAEQTAAIFRDNANGIRTGLLLCYIGCVFYLAFGASINAETERIPGVPAVLLKLQSAAFAATVLLIAGPFMIWLTAAFRPESQSAELIQALNDLGWISFLFGWLPFVTWYMTTGAAILCDTRTTDPLYPRWAGYLSLVLGLGQTSASFLIYFKTGPFAWDGLFSWWLPASEFFLWFVVMTVLSTKAINRRYRESADDTNKRLLR
ncbi:MAG: hypothetical protein VX836_08930 [Pseudomonadota bacterium]|nr:hypothetical protein [Pseudomonadota bacterium]